MNLRTIETSAADVAAALELIMPFGHGSRIPQDYIDEKMRDTEELRNHYTSEAALLEHFEEEHDEENDLLPVEEALLAMKEDLAIRVNEDSPPEEEPLIETEQDSTDLEEHLRSAVGSDKTSLMTEDSTSDDPSGEPPISSTEIVNVDELHIKEEATDETQSEAEEGHVSIAESFDFTISVSISDDEDEVGNASEHLSAVPEESTSIEVIMIPSMVEEDESPLAEEANEEGQEEKKDTKSLVVNDSMTSLDEGKRTVSPSVVKPHIIDIAVEDGEEEYFQSTTSRDSFLIKLSLLGALSDVIYDDFVEQVCEYKALVMTIVKRYDVCLLREIEKPERKSLLKECAKPKTWKQVSKKHEGPCPEEKLAPLQQRKQVLHLEPLELPDFSYVEELVKRTRTQIRENAQSAREAIARQIGCDVAIEEEKDEEMGDEFSYVEELMKQSESQMKESADAIREEAVEVIDAEKFFEEPEPVEPQLGQGSFEEFDIQDEDLIEEREDVEESRDAEDDIDLAQPAMLQGSGKHLPKFRAVFEIVDDGDGEPSTREQSSSVELSPPSSNEVRESAEASAPASSAFTKPKPRFTPRHSNRKAFASQTTMATIRAEVEAKYSKMARPTASFDRETLYARAKQTPETSKYVGIAMSYKNPFGNTAMYTKPVRITEGYKAPEVRVATAYARATVIPEIINLVDMPEPVVDLVDVPEPIVMAE